MGEIIERVSGYRRCSPADASERLALQISDEFQFLEERSRTPLAAEPPAGYAAAADLEERAQRAAPLSSAVSSAADTARFIFTALAIIQILTAVAALIFGSVRYAAIYDVSWRRKNLHRATANLQRNATDALLDFVKVEDSAASNREGTELVGKCFSKNIF